MSIKERIKLFLGKLLSVRTLIVLPLSTILLFFGKIEPIHWMLVVVAVLSFKTFEKLVEKFFAK